MSLHEVQTMLTDLQSTHQWGYEIVAEKITKFPATRKARHERN